MKSTRAFAFAHGTSFEFDPHGVVNQAIKDGVSHSGVGKKVVPLGDGDLRGDASIDQ